MANSKKKYPTEFAHFYEFWNIFLSIPRENLGEWAENLDPKLLWMKDRAGKTVAHWLAGYGTLPEKWITEELFRTKDYYGFTVAHELAYSGTLPERFITEELIRVKDNDGRTVAHKLALSGTLPEEWITKELLRMKDRWGWTVAHDLAKSGTLPEKFITEELLRMKDNDGWTVAGCYFDFLSENNRWDLLTPMLFSIPYRDKTPIIDQVTEDLSGMNDGKFEEALFLMPRETQMKLLSDIKNPDLLERIRKCLDRELESEAFETSPGGDDTDLHSEEREDLYCGVRSDR